MSDWHTIIESTPKGKTLLIKFGDGREFEYDVSMLRCDMDNEYRDYWERRCLEIRGRVEDIVVTAPTVEQRFSALEAERNHWKSNHDETVKRKRIKGDLLKELQAERDALKQHVVDLETRCDPAGEVREWRLTKDENEQLRAALNIAHAEAAGMRKALTDCQWCGWEYRPEVETTVYDDLCPWCGNHEGKGHADNCDIKQALDGTTGTTMLERCKRMEGALRWIMYVTSRTHPTSHAYVSATDWDEFERRAREALGE